MSKTIEVIINPEGKIAIESKGFSGPECEKATAELEKALGVAGNRTKKPEYYRRAQQKVQAKR